jgi:heme A synthase
VSPTYGLTKTKSGLQGCDAVEMLHMLVAGLVVLLTGVIWRASPEETVFKTWTRPSVLPT